MQSSISEMFWIVFIDRIHFLDYDELFLNNGFYFRTIRGIKKYNSHTCDIGNFLQGVIISFAGDFLTETVERLGSVSYGCILDISRLGRYL